METGGVLATSVKTEQEIVQKEKKKKKLMIVVILLKCELWE